MEKEDGFLLFIILDLNKKIYKKTLKGIKSSFILIQWGFFFVVLQFFISTFLSSVFLKFSVTEIVLWDTPPKFPTMLPILSVFAAG